MGLPNEFNKQTMVSYALIVWVAGISFAMGRQFAKIEDAEGARLENKTYLEGEVAGLRSDWERENINLKKAIEENKQYIEYLRKKHGE